MCYNCGCGLPDDDMGAGHALSEVDGKSITNETFQKLAEKWNMSADDAKVLVFQLLNGEKHDHDKEHFLAELYQEGADSQGMTTEQAMEETHKLLKQVLKK